MTSVRLPQAPELTPIADIYPGYDLGIWQSIVAPAGTPRAVIDKLGAAIKAALTDPELREKIRVAGIEPAFSNSPQEFAAFVRAQAETRSKVIRAIGLKLD
jgi:tripartite-type tricarboxylate transporter receptor subunit TctC